MISLIRTLSTQSPNGLHDVLVLPVVQTGVELCQNYYRYGEFLERLSEHHYHIAHQLFEATAFLHEAGVVHGDIRPDNIGYLCEDLNDDDVEWFRDS